MTKYQPHPYQVFVQDFIATHEQAALLLQMGLGKTVITLTALEALLYDTFETRRALVIAPLRVATDTWPSEIAKWDHLQHLDYALAAGTPDQRLAALESNAPIVIISRDNIDWLVNHSGYDFDFDTVVIDELSSFKNHRTKRFKALMKARPRIKRIIGLTGTPTSNGLMDLWAQYRLLDGGQRLGRFIGSYRDRWFTPDKRNQYQIFTYKPMPGAQEEIFEAISDITVSLKTVDHLKMPALVETNHEITLSEANQKVYNQLRANMTAQIGEKEIDASNAAVLAGKLLQLASGAIYDENQNTIEVHQQKLDALEDLIEAANGTPLLIAYWYSHEKQRIKKRFPQVREILTSTDITDWNEGKIPLALIHPASAGHGLNLQHGGSAIVWFTLTWSLELYQQANARLYRQGQTDTVTVTHLVVKGSIDEDIMAAIKNKDFTQQKLINAVKAQIGKEN